MFAPAHDETEWAAGPPGSERWIDLGDIAPWAPERDEILAEIARLAEHLVDPLDEPARPELEVLAVAEMLHSMPDEAAADDLAGAFVAAQRLSAWAFAQAARLAAALARSEEISRACGGLSGAGDPNRMQRMAAAEELAVRTGCSRRTGEQWVHRGVALGGHLCAVDDALTAGRLDVPRALVLLDRLSDVDPRISIPVQDAVLPGAADRTPWQLARDVEHLLLVVEPDEAAERHRRASARRRVERPRPLPDGMASIRAVLTATDAALLDARLDAVARSARAAGDPRSLDQIRADELAAYRSGTPGDAAHVDEPRTNGPGADPSRSERAAAKVRVNVTVALSTLLHLDDDPAHLDRYGPLSAEQARALAAGGTWRRLITDPFDGSVILTDPTRYRPGAALADHVRTRDTRCSAPGCSAPADGCELDHTRPFHATTDPGPTDAGNLAPACHRHHALKTAGVLQVTAEGPGRLRWTSPLGVEAVSEPGDELRRGRLLGKPASLDAADEPGTASDPDG